MAQHSVKLSDRRIPILLDISSRHIIYPASNPPGGGTVPSYPILGTSSTFRSSISPFLTTPVAPYYLTVALSRVGLSFPAYWFLRCVPSGFRFFYSLLVRFASLFHCRLRCFVSPLSSSRSRMISLVMLLSLLDGHSAPLTLCHSNENRCSIPSMPLQHVMH